MGIRRKVYEERPIKSLTTLARTLAILDDDEGIRIIATGIKPSKDRLIFVTKSDGKYCVNLCEKVFSKELGTEIPGGQELWHYFSSPDQVMKFISRKILKPLSAWIY